MSKYCHDSRKYLKSLLVARTRQYLQYYGSIHILRKHSQPQHFHEFFDHFSFKTSMKILSNCNIEKEILLLWWKNSVFFEKFGSQIKFCAIVSAYVLYEWYLSSSMWKPGLSWISFDLEAKKVFKSWRLGVLSKTLFITIDVINGFSLIITPYLASNDKLFFHFCQDVSTEITNRRLF